MSDLLYNPAGLTVMIVDDHDPIRKGIKRVLLSMGFGDIIECFDGDDAIKILGKKPVDLLICDLYMRNVSGFAVLEHLRRGEIGCDIPVIVVTGEASKEEIVKAADLGAEDYVLKPFQASDLEKKVTTVLNKFYSPSPAIKALRQAERLFLAGDLDKALKIFDSVLKSDPNSSRAAHGKARALEKLERPEEAIEVLEETIKRNHSYHKNHGAVADLYLRQNRTTEAIDAMRRELEINPKQTDRQILLAKLLLKEGDPKGAIEHYRIALQDNPKKREALMGMGHALALSENLDKALYYFKRVRRYHPGATKALEQAVRYALTANEPRKAEMLLKDEKQANPNRADTYIVLAMFFLHQGRDDECLAVLEELLEKQPENPHALRLKGLTLLRKAEYEPAAAVLLTVAQIAPTAEILLGLGEAQLGIKKIPEAIETLHKAMAMGPDHPQAFFLLAEAHRRSQQWVKAFYLYCKAARAGANRELCLQEARNCQAEIANRRRPRHIAS